MHENPMACSLFGLGGRGSRGGGGVFQSARGNLPRRKPRYHSLGIRLVALGGFRRDHGVDQLFFAERCPSHHLFLHGPWLGFGISMAEESGSLDTGYGPWGGFRSFR